MLLSTITKMNQKLDRIVEYFKGIDYNLTISEIEHLSDESIDYLVKLIKGERIGVIPKEIYHFAGSYAEKYEFERAEKYDFERAEKYYLLSIEFKTTFFIRSLFNIALLYKRNGNIELSKKYFLMVISAKSSNFANDTIFLYCFVCSLNLVAYIYEMEGNIELAKKYYSMAIKYDSRDPVCDLAHVYRREGNLELAKQFYRWLIEKNGSKFCVVWYIECCNQPLNSILFDLIKENSKIAKLENKITELIYRPGGIGYYAAKDNFSKLSKNNT